MQPKRWNDRFFASTRGQILGLLRRSEQTVNELAAALELTDNAVRAHLAALERDGLVDAQGIRRGMGKPSVVYQLTGEGESLFPKAYGFVLGEVLGLLQERMDAAAFERILSDVGRRAAGGARPQAGSVRERIPAALAVLKETGGDADLEERADGTLTIRGHSCPLARVVSEYPPTCKLMESLLSELIGARVREDCNRSGRPRCVFVVEPELAG